MQRDRSMYLQWACAMIKKETTSINDFTLDWQNQRAVFHNDPVHLEDKDGIGDIPFFCFLRKSFLIFNLRGTTLH